MQPEVATQFDELWESSDAPPDVFAYVDRVTAAGGAGHLNVEVILAVLLRDQQRRWATENPLTVEEYLARIPELQRNRNSKLQLACGEFVARQQCASAPDVGEFTSRFSDIQDTLREQLASYTASDACTIGLDEQHVDRTEPSDSFLSETFASEPVATETCGGRYRLQRVLGEGGFGCVYLAFDQELHRQVALKLPTEKRFKQTKYAELYLEEARTVASLDHPNIVPVYDMGRNEDGSIYVVSKFIEGLTLTEQIKQARPSFNEAADILATAAMGLHHAHQRRVVHRDVKPGNILLEEATGRAYVADFGLAIREEDYLRSNSIAGTPDYMSPEQARGEGHRLDGRSDVYSLGVVLYETLTGKRPFRGSTRNELLHQTISVDPPAIRDLDKSVPAELERICLKALSKRASDRYETAEEFAEDLLSWQNGPASEVAEQHIVPKGLRSFDSDDAEFFLDLLPGPRSRDGLPDVIRFWKTRIEEKDSESTFAIGLIYGPSGCGKSSIVKAGLLPRLSEEVTAIYLEATPSDTEKRILRGLRKHVDDLPAEIGLVDTFSWLRRKEGKKVVIILDQFEQWLHAHRAEQGTELVRALRQCDGGNLQAIVMVRDDFSMAASRFMRELERRILEGHNFSTVDLFDVDHAAKVLTKFGQAFGKLPAQDSAISDEHREFLSAVANGLAMDGKVVSVRLALFAEMVKNKVWVPSTLRDVGGTEGIGANFLEEMFGSRDANPDHLLHQEAARQVLMLMLPEVGSDIKGHMRSHSELLAATDYQGRPGEFNELLRILDGKLRLITPTDPEGSHTDSASDRSLKYYQLTHDYLVPSLREWLTRRQRETRRGRAELILGERSALWNAKPETRHLPSAWEWASIQSLTNHVRWSASQQKMMTTASRIHGTRLAIFIGTFVVCILAAFLLRQRSIDSGNQATAESLVKILTSASLDQVPNTIARIDELRAVVEPKLFEEIEVHPHESKARLNVSLALLPSDPSQLKYLMDRLLHAEPDQLDTIRSQMKPHHEELTPQLWRLMLSPSEAEKSQLLQAASTLAEYDPKNPDWAIVAARVTEALVSENSLRAATWIRALKPVRQQLIQPLGVIYRETPPSRSQSQIDRATVILADYAADLPDVLADLLMDAKPEQFVELFDEFAAHDSISRQRLKAELNRRLSHDWEDPPLDPDWVALPAEVRRDFEESDGILAERFAFAQTMNRSDFKAVVDPMRLAGYRLTRIRPYEHESGVLIASCWSRDDRDWRLLLDVKLDSIHRNDEEFRGEGFVAVDVAGYVDPMRDGDRYAGVWMGQRETSEDSRIFAGVLHGEIPRMYDALAQSGHQFTNVLQCFRDELGQRRFCGVVLNERNASTFFLNRSSRDYADSQFLHRIAWDLDPSRARDPMRPLVRNRMTLQGLQPKERDSKDPHATDLALAKAHLNLDDMERAKQYFDSVIDGLTEEIVEKGLPSKVRSQLLAEAYRHRAILGAKTGNESDAKKDLLALERWSEFELLMISGRVIVAAHLDQDMAAGLNQLEEFIDQASTSSEEFFGAACCYASISGVVQEGNITLSRLYGERAVALLKKACELGLNDEQRIDLEPDLDPLRPLHAFETLMDSTSLATRYTAVWNDSSWLESMTSHGVSVEEHAADAENMAKQGYRIASLGLASVSGEPVVGAVWHRPIVQEDRKEALARRQANAAVAALRMGESEQVWPLLQDSPDPRLQSWILQLLVPSGASPVSLLERLPLEKNAAVRRALILGLGEFNQSSQIENESKVKALLDIYRDDPDPGIHSASAWALNRLGQQAEVDQIDKTLSALQNKPVNAEGLSWHHVSEGHTMISIPGPVEFQMGSPYPEPNRSTFEHLHHVRIGRSFSIASTEVTVGQFETFLKDSTLPGVSIQRKYAPEDDCPVVAVTWFAAASYCRWLSEQEGVAPDQMCYPPIEEIRTGMVLPENYLSRTGYRLPTEAEWEYACRAGATTSRYYGATDALLRHYAWYLNNADGRVWPVGMLKPNAFGLFDMHGNVQEWCQSVDQQYNKSLGSVTVDREDLAPVNNTDRRSLRGGSWVARVGEVRSAHRDFNRVINQFNASGFRVARTIADEP